MDSLCVLIVDDEAPSRRKIRNFLKDEPGLILLEAENGTEAVALIRTRKPDLLFLDIQMPGMDGFELIETVGPEAVPAVVFITAFDQYAIAAFDVQAVDYLLKPFDRDRFFKAFRRAVERLREKGRGVADLSSLLAEVRRGKGYAERLSVRKGDSVVFVKTAEIRHISADEKYVRLHTAAGEWTIREPIGSLEGRLDPARFARIHKSHIVNRDEVREVQPWSHGDSIVILKDGAQIPMSRRYRDNLLDR
jgi:two-component system, LytTR family, response regulator